MGETLNGLHQLQTVEIKLAAIRRTQQAKQRRVEICRSRYDKIEQELEQQRRQNLERKARLDALGLDVASREEAVNKHRQALAKARTNKEYAAILSAMNTEKADNTKIENTMLEMMEEIQVQQDALVEAETEKAKLFEEASAAEEQLQEFDAESKPKRCELESARDEGALRIAPSTLLTFNRAAMRHEGEAMVPIQKVHPKRDGFVCSGCNMSIALEVVNVLQTRDEIQFCGACGRILFLEARG